MNVAPNNFKLYTLTCLANKRVYIGVCRWFYQRRSKHLYDLKNKNHTNKRLQEDYNTFGPKQFVFDVVATYQTKQEALRIEKYYTDVIYGVGSELCYNVISGGSDNCRQIRAIHANNLKSEEYRAKFSQKISLALKGRKLSKETRSKLSKSRMGYKMSSEFCEGRSVAYSGAGNPKAKKVIDTNTGIIYDCLKNAAVALSINYDTLRHRVNGDNKTPTSVKWL